MSLVNKSFSGNLFLGDELKWLESVISKKNEAGNRKAERKLPVAPDPTARLKFSTDPYANFVHQKKLSEDERFLLILAISTNLNPSVLKGLVEKGGGYKPVQFSEGGTFSKEGRAFLPTVETFLFLRAGADILTRIELQRLFREEHIFFSSHILQLSSGSQMDSFLLNRRILVSEEFYRVHVMGEEYFPSFGSGFPAKKVGTKLNWDDLVLRKSTQDQVDELRKWLKFKERLANELGMSKKMKLGYRALFYGPPGTGKTLTAKILGNELNKPVYRIDLSMVVSKYIGETEKNLAKIFDKAERFDWILFFDEADALFGKRTTTESSNDRYANQEVGYLLQRVEDYSGMAILASNFKNNIDKAFLRRFDSMVYFPIPKKEERIKLWELSIPSQVQLAENIDLKELARKYELTGAHITNVISHALIEMLAQEKEELDAATIHTSVIRELSKEGRTA